MSKDAYEERKMASRHVQSLATVTWVFVYDDTSVWWRAGPDDVEMWEVHVFMDRLPGIGGLVLLDTIHRGRERSTETTSHQNYLPYLRS